MSHNITKKDVDVRHHGFERIRFEATTAVWLNPKQFHALAKGIVPIDTEFQSSLDWATRTLMVHMRSYLLRSPIVEKRTTYFEVPSTWWQHLKRDHFPAWLLRRFPVEMTKVPFEYETNLRVCPHSDTSFPADQAHIDFLVSDSFGDPEKE